MNPEDTIPAPPAVSTTIPAPPPSDTGMVFSLEIDPDDTLPPFDLDA